MTNDRLPHSDEALYANRETQDSLKPYSVLPDASSFDLEIDAPGGIGVKLKAQGRATVAVVIALLVAGVSIGTGGSAFLKNDQPNLPTVERKQ